METLKRSCRCLQPSRSQRSASKANGDKGPPGFAAAEFRKLTKADRCAIASVLKRDGEIHLGGMWAGTYLKDRRWERPPLRDASPRPLSFAGIAAGMVAALRERPDSRFYRADIRPPPPDPIEIAPTKARN
jgi:hypothetical protein